MKRAIYLDNAATTFPKPESVYAAVDAANRNLAVNAGRGDHAMSKRASAVIAQTREAVASLVHAPADSHVILVPSATHALNQIILGMPWPAYAHAYVTPFEHNAVMRPLHAAAQAHGFAITQMKFDLAAQQPALDMVAAQFAANPPHAVFISHVSNVTGAILPVRALAQLAKAYGAVVVVDVAQSMGVLPIDMTDWPVDYLVFAGHKTLQGVFGIGGFVQRDGRDLTPVLFGGTGTDSLNLSMPSSLPERLEPSSPNLPAIAGLEAGIAFARANDLFTHEQGLTRYLREGLGAIDSITTYMPADASCHLGIVSFNHAQYLAHELGEILDQDFGIAVRAGYHCAPLVHGLLGTEAKQGTVRASIGFATTAADIDALIDALKELDE